MRILTDKRLFASLAFGLLVAIVPLLGHAETLSGRLNGYNCAQRGEVCPVDRLDPHIALEPDFVLQQPDGEYYFLVNVPRKIKVRHVLSDIRIKGDINETHHSVNVSELHVKIDDEYNKVWSLAAMERERQLRKAYFPTNYQSQPSNN